jgi:hypothetical protein
MVHQTEFAPAFALHMSRNAGQRPQLQEAAPRPSIASELQEQITYLTCLRIRSLYYLHETDRTPLIHFPSCSFQWIDNCHLVHLPFCTLDYRRAERIHTPTQVLFGYN